VIVKAGKVQTVPCSPFYFKKGLIYIYIYTYIHIYDGFTRVYIIIDPDFLDFFSSSTHVSGELIKVEPASLLRIFLDKRGTIIICQLTNKN